MSVTGDGEPLTGQVANSAIGLIAPLDEIDATTWLGPMGTLVAVRT